MDAVICDRCGKIFRADPMHMSVGIGDKRIGAFIPIDTKDLCIDCMESFGLWMDAFKFKADEEKEAEE